MSETPSHSDLVKLAVRWLTRQNCYVVLREFSTNHLSEIPDAIGFRPASTVTIECKTSRADFLADQKKRSRINPTLGMGHWRYYLTPKGLLKPEEIPDGWGLLETTGRNVQRVHGGWEGNYIPDPTTPQPDGRVTSAPFTPNTSYERAYLYAALRRLAMRGRLSEVYASPGQELPDGDVDELKVALVKAELRAERLALQLNEERRVRKRAEGLNAMFELAAKDLVPIEREA